MFTFIPFICAFVVEMHSVDNTRFAKDHGVFQHTFRAAGEMIFYTNSSLTQLYIFIQMQISKKKLENWVLPNK